MELSLTNYQSWSSAALKVEGLTVVVGPSNLGKSAMGRAFKSLVRNDLLPDHIKLGTEGVRVTATFSGSTITASRGAKAKDSTVYTVDGQEFTKLGGDVPQAVKDMSFGPVDINGVTIDPVFAGQFDGQFLLGSSPAELNAVLNAFASTEKLDRGRRELARRTTEVNATAKALVPQISALEEQSANLEEVLAAAEASHAEAQAAAEAVTRLDKAVAACGALLDASEKLRVLQHQIIGLSTLLNVRDETIRVYKATARAILAWTAQDTLATVRAQGVRIVEALGFLNPTTELFNAARAAQDGLAAMAARGDAGTKAEKIAEALEHLPVASTAFARAQGLHVYKTSRLTAAKATDRVLALEDMEAQLRPCLVSYKALVRIKALVTTDPAKPRALAQQVQDLPLNKPGKLLQAGIILQKLLSLGASAETTRDNLKTLGQDLQAIQTETTQINAQIDQAREAGVIVTCPKCSHEFSTAHAH